MWLPRREVNTVTESGQEARRRGWNCSQLPVARIRPAWLLVFPSLFLLQPSLCWPPNNPPQPRVSLRGNLRCSAGTPLPATPATPAHTRPYPPTPQYCSPGFGCSALMRLRRWETDVPLGSYISPSSLFCGKESADPELPWQSWAPCVVLEAQEAVVAGHDEEN